MKKKCLFLLFVMLIFSSLSSISLGVTEKLTYLGGQAGGSAELLGVGIAEIVHKVFPEILIDYSLGGGIANTMAISGDATLIGQTHSYVAKAAAQGMEPFEKQFPNLMALCSTTISQVQNVALESTGITSIRQIKDEKIPVRISVGDPGGTTELATRRLLNAYGITYDDIKKYGGTVFFKQMTEANDMMKMGRIDLQFNTGAAPLAVFSELATTHDIRLLPIDEDVIEILDENYGYSKSYISPETYSFVTKETPTATFVCIVLCNKDLSEEVAYKITKSIGDNLNFFYDMNVAHKHITHENMYQNTGVELHPGAIRYYKEIGVMK